MKKILILALLYLIQAFFTRGIIAQDLQQSSFIGKNYLVETFREHEILIYTQDVAIGGTLIIPDHKRTNELVILSSGSGPQDRDETLYGFPVFKVIAHHLGNEGIASFRYDDRGIGTSTGDFVNSTLDNLTEDILEIIHFFNSNGTYQFDNYILFGHSQGGIVTAKAAVNNDNVKKLILMAAPAVPLVEVLTAQLRRESKESGLPASLVEIEVSAHNKLMKATHAKKNLKEAISNFHKTSKLILYHTVNDTSHVGEMATTTTEEFRVLYSLPSLVSFLYHDPVSDLKQLKIPVLGLFAGQDTQVTIPQNKDRMENTLLTAGIDFKFTTFDRANHFFQEAESGKRGEYESLDKAFTDDFLTEITNWIKEDEHQSSCKRDKR